jgi:hypothetical protein
MDYWEEGFLTERDVARLLCPDPEQCRPRSARRCSYVYRCNCSPPRLAVLPGLENSVVLFDAKEMTAVPGVTLNDAGRRQNLLVDALRFGREFLGVEGMNDIVLETLPEREEMSRDFDAETSMSGMCVKCQIAMVEMSQVGLVELPDGSSAVSIRDEVPSDMPFVIAPHRQRKKKKKKR